MQVIQLKTCPRQFATLCALNPYHWMETKFVRYSHLIFVGFRYKIGDSLSPNFNPSFSASAKLTERLHGSSEYIAPRQPNHNGPVPTSNKLHKASTVFLHPKQTCFDHSSFQFFPFVADEWIQWVWGAQTEEIWQADRFACHAGLHGPGWRGWFPLIVERAQVASIFF